MQKETGMSGDTVMINGNAIGKADILIKNASIFTVDDDNPLADSIAVKDGIIMYVGTSERTEKYIGRETEVIDCDGKFILPGFFDNHCHPSCYTYRAIGAQLFNCTDIKDYQDAIGKYIYNNPKLDIIKGCGWFFSDFDSSGPKKEFLDEITTDKPILLYSGDFHNAWVNSNAIKMAGINSSTPDPDGGYIIRDGEGDPTGFFNEAPAVAMLEDRLRGFSSEDFKTGLIEFFKKANEAGITSVRESGVIQDGGYEGYKLLDDEDITLNVYLDVFINHIGKKNISEKLEDAILVMNELSRQNIKTNSIKLFMDGVAEANTALLEDPYLNESNNRGTPLWDLYEFNEICRKIDEKGLQIHVHAIGDRAVRYTLNAFEYAEIANGKRDSRHQIAHVQLLNNDDLKRLYKLGVTVAPTPLWYEKGSLYYNVELNNLGGERADKEYKFKSLLHNDIKVACGSDTPAATAPDVLPIPFSPVLSIQQGITRCAALSDPNDMRQVLNPTEKSDLHEMIKAHTINSAYACFAEDKAGSLQKGKKADLVMLDQNIFEIETTEIYTTNVLMTMLDGKIVYSK